ncbi:UNVERIFIED_CONTAM: hypothetical protein FKN15_044867 [Acipenser sinensis]
MLRLCLEYMRQLFFTEGRGTAALRKVCSWVESSTYTLIQANLFLKINITSITFITVWVPTHTTPVLSFRRCSSEVATCLYSGTQNRQIGLDYKREIKENTCKHIHIASETLGNQRKGVQVRWQLCFRVCGLEEQWLSVPLCDITDPRLSPGTHTGLCDITDPLRSGGEHYQPVEEWIQ